MYTLLLEDDLIVIHCYTLRTAPGVKALREDVEAILRSKDQPQDILVLLTSKVRTGHRPSIELVQIAVRAIREVHFRRAAVVGTIPSRIASANLILKAGSKSDRMKIFRSEEDARAWLAEPPKK